MISVPFLLLVVLGVSAIAGVWVSVSAWRRQGDPFILKIATTVVAFAPIVGPLFALWVLSFPERMHPNLQATYPKRVNHYSSPHVSAADAQSNRRWPSWHIRKRGPHGKGSRKDNAA